jgi:hypothetical protein
MIVEEINCLQNAKENLAASVVLCTVYRKIFPSLKVGCGSGLKPFQIHNTFFIEIRIHNIGLD